MHGHDDRGHDHAHDDGEWESFTYGDIGVACLAVFKQDLVNLRRQLIVSTILVQIF